MDGDGGDRKGIATAHVWYREGVHVQWARVSIQVCGQAHPYLYTAALHPLIIGTDNSTRMCISYEFQRFVPHV